MEMTVNEVKTITTRIRGVEKLKFRAKRSGAETVMVLIKTEDGGFTNYMNVWKAQKIDLGEVDEGDAVEIVYTTYYDGNKKRTYKNFQAVKLI